MFDLIYQDEFLVAMHKPPGILVHKSAIDAYEQRCVLQSLSEQLNCYLYPVHRLDKATSGVLMFALSSTIARQIQWQFEQHTIAKTYVAVVRGYVDGTGLIDHPLSDKRELRRSGAPVNYRESPVKPAVTRYRALLTAQIPLACGPYSQSRYSLVALQPQSGRRHQLRRHMKHISHPIIGDTTHGQGCHNRLFRDHFDSRRLLLCATSLTCQHPVTDNTLEFSTGLDADFMRVAIELGWERSVIDSALVEAKSSVEYTRTLNGV